MLERLFQMLFTALAFFAPVIALADCPGGGVGNGNMMDANMMNGDMFGHGAFGPILALLLFTVAVGIIFMAIKLFVGPEEHHRPPPA